VNGFVGFGNLLGLTDPLAQDQLVVVPIPMTLGLAAVGLAGVVAIRRRRG
jgi:MYXO-CTERM domain-containing protein